MDMCPQLCRSGVFIRCFTRTAPQGRRVSWPGEMLLACSFDVDALYQMGNAVGAECEAQQVDVWLAPALNLHRHPLGGRNFEYYSEDPFLTGAMGAAVLRGVQENHKVLVCAKHFAANEQETYRRGSAKLENGIPCFRRSGLPCLGARPTGAVPQAIPDGGGGRASLCDDLLQQS